MVDVLPNLGKFRNLHSSMFNRHFHRVLKATFVLMNINEQISFCDNPAKVIAVHRVSQTEAKYVDLNILCTVAYVITVSRLLIRI